MNRRFRTTSKDSETADAHLETLVRAGLEGRGDESLRPGIATPPGQVFVEQCFYGHFQPGIESDPGNGFGKNVIRLRDEISLSVDETGKAGPAIAKVEPEKGADSAGKMLGEFLHQRTAGGGQRSIRIEE